MRIAIDVSPLQSGHKIRGVGFYLEYLKRALLEYFPENEYTFFKQQKEIPENVDVVHYPYFDPFFITLPLIKKHKTVVTVHDLTPLVFPDHFPAGIKGNLKWQIQKQNLKRVDMIITDSLASKKDIIKIAGVNESKIAVAYLAAADEFKKINSSKSEIAALRKKYDLPEKFVLYVGDVTWNKNLPNFIHAVQKAELPLVMVGKNLAQKEFDRENPWNKDLVTVQNLVRRDKNITTLGFIPTEDLEALYNIATVFVMPSLYEGFGLPVIEAMQSGCPVVTTKGGSLPEVAGSAAYYVDGTKIDNMSEGIKKIFSETKLQDEMAKKGLGQAKEFSWKKTAEQTMEVYKSTIAG